MRFMNIFNMLKNFLHVEEIYFKNYVGLIRRLVCFLFVMKLVARQVKLHFLHSDPFGVGCLHFMKGLLSFELISLVYVLLLRFCEINLMVNDIVLLF